MPGKTPTYTYGEIVDGQWKRTDKIRFVITTYPPALRTGASLTTSAEEIGRWIIALNSGKLISAETRKRMWTPVIVKDAGYFNWSMGWPSVVRAEHPASVGIGGGMSAFYVYPEDDVAVVILTNLQGGQPEQYIEKVAELYGSE